MISCCAAGRPARLRVGRGRVQGPTGPLPDRTAPSTGPPVSLVCDVSLGCLWIPEISRVGTRVRGTPSWWWSACRRVKARRRASAPSAMRRNVRVWPSRSPPLSGTPVKGRGRSRLPGTSRWRAGFEGQVAGAHGQSGAWYANPGCLERSYSAAGAVALSGVSAAAAFWFWSTFRNRNQLSGVADRGCDQSAGRDAEGGRSGKRRVDVVRALRRERMRCPGDDGETGGGDMACRDGAVSGQADPVTEADHDEYRQVPGWAKRRTDRGREGRVRSGDRGDRRMRHGATPYPFPALTFSSGC